VHFFPTIAYRTTRCSTGPKPMSGEPTSYTSIILKSYPPKIAPEVVPKGREFTDKNTILVKNRKKLVTFIYQKWLSVILEASAQLHVIL
jgi:hypothetical protein